MASFKERWNITSNKQMIIIIIVFAVTGSTSALLSKPILAYFGIIKGEVSNWVYYPLYIVLIFPVYQILLVSFGYLSGQFKFFWAFEKKMLRSLGFGFFFKKENPKH